MRAVLDTNVVVSALIWGGNPLALLEAAAEGRIELFTSPVLLAELETVLRRPHLTRRLRSVRGDVRLALRLYAERTGVVTPGVVARAVPDDADDDHVVAAAVAAGADVIVSGDQHLLGVGLYQGIQILRPVEALEWISAG
jgi:putative PIN family toxin of toxin-antitoxin system